MVWFRPDVGLNKERSLATIKGWMVDSLEILLITSLNPRFKLSAGKFQ